MIHDPEEIRERRRDPEPVRAPSTENAPGEPTVGRRQTAELLARLREGDDLADGVRMLCRWRSDRHDLATIAADEGLDVATVQARIDAALRAEGSSFAAAAALQRRRKVQLGRGTRQQQLIDEADQARHRARIYCAAPAKALQ